MRISDWSSDVCSSDLAAGERGDEAVQLADVGDLDLAEADVDVEGIRHHAGQRVAELVEHDEGEDEQPAAPGQEVGEGGDDGARQPFGDAGPAGRTEGADRQSTRLNSSH